MAIFVEIRWLNFIVTTRKSRDVGLNSRQRVKLRAEASINLTPILLVVTLFKHYQVNNWIDIVMFFCPLPFCIIKQARLPPK